MSQHHTETSKFLSYVLRHAPESIGLVLDRDGWVDIDALVAAANADGKALDAALIRAVISSSDKQRFALSADGLRMRAVQGHSTASVALAHVAKAPPTLLYHGTATRFLDAILREGLRPGQRHHVHLSADAQTAMDVGARYGTPVLLIVQAGQMHDQGLPLFQADNGVWLTDAVPVAFLTRAG
ncbi:RNA 2'-phosphotransferase [Xanthomonas pisi]|uniref:Probable RNA 2'-phosphotransferase n=1 Tax=Xanthomonas pisi TaxID=56457 RepID=A0A2S7CX80_9XANT|nr:RNA 2'-phosphotransferase [Xanthomonas pisi]KLD69696.1 RNA 2'-phosphotransferase [Xanthomonas pisi DSM 18956]PPU66176.1 RNA 2'-phosphotransferase [Xanthomonas pisi]